MLSINQIKVDQVICKVTAINSAISEAEGIDPDSIISLQPVFNTDPVDCFIKQNGLSEMPIIVYLKKNPPFYATSMNNLHIFEFQLFIINHESFLYCFNFNKCCLLQNGRKV